MTREDIIKIANVAADQSPRQDWNTTAWVFGVEALERFTYLVAATKQNACAQWMIEKGYATGHGDSVADLLEELEWQVKEQERNACARMVEPVDESLADSIRARGKK